MGADEDLPLGPFRVRDFLRGKSVVHHHHGEPPFRENPRQFAEREIALGRKAIVSTPDLLRGYPEATWVPNIVPLEEGPYTPKTGSESRDGVIVGHSPTKTELKNTAEFRRVMGMVSDRHPGVTTRIIENTPHLECLSLKRDCDIFFDHMQGYFGVSSLEALALGLPVIAGLDRWNREQIRERTGTGELPWVLAHNTVQLEERVETLVEDEAMRTGIGRQSRTWMEKNWTADRWAALLDGVYREAA
jgi:hypothetical protein